MGKIFFLGVLASLMVFGNHYVYGQSVGVSTMGLTPDVSALLDVDATGMTPQKGMLIPRITLTSATDDATIATPATSLLVYNTGIGAITPDGYYYNQGTTGAPNWVLFKTNQNATIPTLNSYTASGTWTKPANLSYIIVEVWGAGGGGGGGANAGGTGGTGVSSTYTYNSGGNTITATGGAGGIGGGNCGNVINGSAGGIGGSAAGGDINISGAAGGGGQTSDGGYGQAGSGGGMAGGAGGGCGGGSGNGSNGGTASGGGGGAGWSNAYGGGAGGGSGAYAKKIIPESSLGATETITVGTGGAAGAGGTTTGGSGGDGLIVIYQYFR